MDIILKEITEAKDLGYRDFHARLMPTVDRERILGLRSPAAQRIAKKYAGSYEGELFLSSLPHRYYDENIVHAFMLCHLKCPLEELKDRITRFLPYVDNWAVCDGLCAHLKCFFKNPREVYGFVLEAVKSTHPYTVRFGLVCLLNYYIDSEHIDDILRICRELKSDEYYVNMAIAWLLSFCLIKEYEATIPLIEERILDKWVHNKAIQKSIESYRIDKDQKAYLRSLKIK